MQNIDPKKWFDRMQPQTLQIATWLLYFDGFFALVNVTYKSGYIGYLRNQYPFGFLLGIISVALYVSGGLLMANDLKIGYKLSVAAAALPFVLRFLAVRSYAQKFEVQSPIGIIDYITGRIFGGSVISSAFDVAVLALLLHAQSREHQRIWYR
jgi:uncharacterized membrane protein (UPF0136 family)